MIYLDVNTSSSGKTAKSEMMLFLQRQELSDSTSVSQQIIFDDETCNFCLFFNGQKKKNDTWCSKVLDRNSQKRKKKNLKCAKHNCIKFYNNCLNNSLIK